MELPTGVNRRYASVAGFLLVAIWCWVAFDRPYAFPDHIPWNIYSSSPQTRPTTDIFDFPPVMSPAIQKICGNVDFNETIIFTCDHSIGNVAEVKNSILHCVRYAMAAGASLLLPKIVVEADDAGVQESSIYELDYFFETKHFIQSLKLSCPQMRVYESLKDVPNAQAATAPIPLDPPSVAVTSKGGQLIPTEYRASFLRWLEQLTSPNDRGPIIIELARSYLQWPINSDKKPFVEHFGRLLKVRSDIRTLTTTILNKLGSTYSLNLRLDKPIFSRAYLGAYLTLWDQGHKSKDMERLQARFDAQSELYLSQATASNLSLVYLAADDTTFIPKFISLANAASIKVTTKFDLVKGKEKEELKSLSLHQQAIVDFLILTRGTDFAGVGYSSLAWNVALRRHQDSDQEEEWLNAETALLSDELSQIYGPPGSHQEVPACMWP